MQPEDIKLTAKDEEFLAAKRRIILGICYGFSPRPAGFVMGESAIQQAREAFEAKLATGEHGREFAVDEGRETRNG